jgi:tRNA1Val (adenine37-N6)-methyltransferase
VSVRRAFVQPEPGYRFSLDALILASYLHERRFEGRAVEIGSGCGVISVLSASAGRLARVDGIELQPVLHEAARANLARHGPALACPVAFHLGDVRQAEAWRHLEGADLVFANPPFHRLGAGRPSADPVARLARHEVTLDAGSLGLALARLLAPEGAGVVLYPEPRAEGVTRAMEAAGLRLRRRLDLRSAADDQRAYRVILELGRGAPARIQRHQRVVLDRPGVYAEWLRPWVSGPGSEACDG